MNFIASKSKRPKKQNDIVSLKLLDLYPTDISMYKIPPIEEITLNEMQEIAYERVQLLRLIEQTTGKGYAMLTNEWRECFITDVTKAGLKKYLRLLKSNGSSNTTTEADLQARRIDNISHFLLRLAYCRSEELRRWFVEREMELFKLRFIELTSDSVNKFLQLNNFNYSPISAEEKATFRVELINSIFFLHDSNFDKTDIYKVHFSDVCSLVRNRKCFVHKSYAYIPNTDLVTCILTSYKIHLNESLAKNLRALPLINDEHLDDLLPYLHTSYVGKSYIPSTDHEAINIENLDQHAKENYPLCMRHIHESFRANHHLRHGSRLQYGFFIKGIGVRYEDAMNFWRDEFTKQIDGNKFDKQYSYTFKHQYGKVGNMKNYTPYSCMKIITSSVSAGESHGCPFKHWETHSLQQKLKVYGFSAEVIEEISELTTKGHFQLACTKYFESVHKQPSKNVINHPNQYFEESMELHKATNQKK